MTEELEKAIEAAKTDEEKKAVAEKFEDELLSLSEEELDSIAGGWKLGVTCICEKCGRKVREYNCETDENGNLIHKNCGGHIRTVPIPVIHSW